VSLAVEHRQVAEDLQCEECPQLEGRPEAVGYPRLEDLQAVEARQLEGHPLPEEQSQLVDGDRLMCQRIPLIEVVRWLIPKRFNPALSQVMLQLLPHITTRLIFNILRLTVLYSITLALRRRILNTRGRIRRTFPIRSRTISSKWKGRFTITSESANPLSSNTQNPAAGAAGGAVIGGVAGAGVYSAVNGGDEPEGEYAPEGYYLAEDGYYYPNDEGYEGQDGYYEGQDGYYDGQEGYQGQDASTNEASYESSTAYQAPAEVEQPTYEQPEATKTEAYEPATTTPAAGDNDNTSTKSDSDGCCGCVIM